MQVALIRYYFSLLDLDYNGNFLPIIRCLVLGIAIATTPVNMRQFSDSGLPILNVLPGKESFPILMFAHTAPARTTPAMKITGNEMSFAFFVLRRLP